MRFFIENWLLIIVAISVVVLIILAIKKFLNRPSSEQLEKVKAWLLWAVTQAERDLGSGTGRLKLSKVYDMFIGKFPWLVQVISFVSFSDLVDSALDVMRNILKENKAAAAIVNGEAEE